MAQKIVFHYPDMETSANNIRNIAQNYENAANTLIAALDNATAGWEGHSKDKFMDFIHNAVQTHTAVNVPTMVRGVATLLDNNRTSMENADQQVGNKMPTSL